MQGIGCIGWLRDLVQRHYNFVRTHLALKFGSTCKTPAIVLWGDGSDTSCQVTPGPEGDAFQSFMALRPESFESGVRLSDGTRTPGCD